MNATWNLPILERPPYITWQISPLDAKKLGVDVTRYKTVLGAAIHDLSSITFLKLDAAVLSRLIYRMKRKFRNDKGFMYMVKLNKALVNCYNIFLIKEYQTLRSDLRIEDGLYILPTRQRLEYTLVRTQGFAKLMDRIEQSAKCSGHLLKSRMKSGHAWSITLVAYANISRIWLCSRAILRKCCKWYNELYQCAAQFKYIGAVWFPKHQSLPCDLKLWLSLSWIDDLDDSQSKLQDWQKIFGLPTEACNDISKMNFITHHKKTDNSRLTQAVESASVDNILDNMSTSNTDTNDIGEVVDRKTFNNNLPKDNPFLQIKRQRKNSNERRKEPKMKKRKQIEK
ncbi:hypothetical protein P5V15_009363 [Pogonomyrmex californicus]